MSKVYMTFKNILSKLLFAFTSTTILETSNIERLKTAVEHRTTQVLKPIHYAAHNMLNPKAEGHELTENQDSEAMEFIHNLANFLSLDCLGSLAQYRARDGIWGNEFTWNAAETVDAVWWWKGICEASPLSKVALCILTAPCTSAATERSFSIHGFIHSAKRNRLTTERAAQITSLAYNWNLKQNNDRSKNIQLSNVNDQSINTEINDSLSDDYESDEFNLIQVNMPDDPQPSTSRSTNQELEFVDAYNMNLSDDDDN